MFHGKRLEMRRLPALGVGGRRSDFFQRCVGMGFVEAEDENAPPSLVRLAAGTEGGV